jgi:hypothetical protein
VAGAGRTATRELVSSRASIGAVGISSVALALEGDATAGVSAVRQRLVANATTSTIAIETAAAIRRTTDVRDRAGFTTPRSSLRS